MLISASITKRFSFHDDSKKAVTQTGGRSHTYLCSVSELDEGEETKTSGEHFSMTTIILFETKKCVREEREDEVNEGSCKRKTNKLSGFFYTAHFFNVVLLFVSSENVFALKALIYCHICNLKIFFVFVGHSERWRRTQRRFSGM